MTNAEYYKSRPDELAQKLDWLLETGSNWTTKTDGQRIAEFLCGERESIGNTTGETTFIVTIDVQNTIRGKIDDVQRTADHLETLYKVTAESALKNIFGDTRDADNVTVRYTKVYPDDEMS